LTVYNVELSSAVSDTFRCTKAANSLDIDVGKKSIHRFQVDADFDTDFNLALIYGASGSGKTTLGESIWGKDVFKEKLVLDKPVIDQFPDAMTYEDCQRLLSGVGLTAVPCWIRPAFTLSNGQRARAEIALQMASDSDFIVIDEWTSVVDRTVAKVMSFCIAKFARRQKKRSCFYPAITTCSNGSTRIFLSIATSRNTSIGGYFGEDTSEKKNSTLTLDPLAESRGDILASITI